MFDKIKGYKTVILNSLMSISGLLVGFGLISQEIQTLITTNAEPLFAAVMTIWGIINVGLRSVTDTKLGSSE